MITQQKDTVDPEVRQQIEAAQMEYNETFDNNDAAALAALFTEDAVLVTDRGPVYGREAVEKHFGDLFRKWHCSNHIGKRDQYSPHIIGTAGNEVWSNGEWSLTLQGQNGGPMQLKGYWSSISVREGNA